MCSTMHKLSYLNRDKIIDHFYRLLNKVDIAYTFKNEYWKFCDNWNVGRNLYWIDLKKNILTSNLIIDWRYSFIVANVEMKEIIIVF